MRSVALLLCVCLSASAAPPPAAERQVAYDMEPLEVTAPRESPETIRKLKNTRAAGGAVAVSGAGLLVYSAFAAGGPVGWAAGLLYAGGMAAYLSHRRLNGVDDLRPEGRPQLAEARRER